MERRIRSLMLLAAIGGGFFNAAAHGDDGSPEQPHTTRPDWPQWRGPTRDGQVTGPAWPDSLTGMRIKPLWRVKLDAGYSGPLVSADTVFVTETRAQSEEVVRALDRTTGEERWQARWAGALSVPFFAKANGDWIRSTPAYDDGALYVAGMRDVLVCLNAKTGAERWKVDFPQRDKTPLPAFGFVCSPLVDAEGVYVQAGAAFVKLNKRTGATLWRTLADDGGMSGSAFSSPSLATLHGRSQLLVQTRTTLAGVDPASGAVLWRQEVPAFRGMNILTPTAIGDAVFTSSYGGKTFLFRPSSENPATVATVWTNRAQGYMSSPVVVDGHAYLHLRNQRVTCINLATGVETWTTTPFGKYWSLVANGDKILALDEQGVLYLIRANPDRYEQLDSRKIADAETWGHLSVCGDELYIRELNAIAAYRWLAGE